MAEETESNWRGLYDAGWRQGSVFSLECSEIWVAGISTEDGIYRAQVKSKPLKDKHRLVVITQNCDLISRAEPRVEALVVSPKPAKTPGDVSYLERVLEHGVRLFLLDRDRLLFAEIQRRIIIDKSLLVGKVPEWQLPDDRVLDFQSWLAGRFDRPDFPDPVVEGVCNPVREMLEEMRDSNLMGYQALKDAIKEIRVFVPADASGLSTRLLIILQDEVEEAGAVAVVGFTSAVEQNVQIRTPGAACEVERQLYGDVMLAEYDCTEPIDLDHLTVGGRELLRQRLAPVIEEHIVVDRR